MHKPHNTKLTFRKMGVPKALRVISEYEQRCLPVRV